MGKLVKDEDYRIAYLAKYLMSLIVGLWRGIVQERRNAEQMRNVVYQARCYHKAVWFSMVHGMLRIWTQAKDSAQWRVEHLFMPWVEIRHPPPPDEHDEFILVRAMHVVQSWIAAVVKWRMIRRLRYCRADIQRQALMKEMVKWWHDMADFEGGLVEWEDEEELEYWEATER